MNDLCHTYEPNGPVNSQQMLDEYARLDADKAYTSNIGPNERIVYDSIEYPPTGKDGTPYIDDNDLIEIQQEEPPVDSRKYYPYGPTGQTSNLNPKQMRINRYYSKLRPYYTLESKDDTTLLFESRFESGNLRRAQKIDDYEYNLWLRCDYNTTSQQQWFYF